ncbi:MAG: hypothetical protein K2W96_02985 [Gemmataceae bacterium]|nr:hypothetical protein [Gemmataceae bacterium]
MPPDPEPDRLAPLLARIRQQAEEIVRLLEAHRPVGEAVEALGTALAEADRIQADSDPAAYRRLLEETQAVVAQAEVRASARLAELAAQVAEAALASRGSRAYKGQGSH